MKKVCTITFHHAKNYGAVLQCYALQQYLVKLGCDVKSIDFKTENMTYQVIPKPHNFKSLIRNILKLKSYKKIKTKFEKYDRFVREHLMLTRRYSSIDDLRRDPPEADIVITGSDQVFNPNRRSDERQAYYLDFPCKVRASFSASFGSSLIPEDKISEIRNYIEKFDMVSVRENYAVDMINDICDDVRVYHTIDPVFLLDAVKWSRLEEKYDGLPEKFIFAFCLRESKSIFTIVNELKKETGLPVVMISDKPNMPIKCDYVLRDAGPQNYLWLIHNCEYFVQDSFHATAFSLIFHKKFIFADDHPASYERGRALLNLVKHPELYRLDEGVKYMMSEIDYDEVDDVINEKVIESEKYLSELLKTGDEMIK